MLLKLGSTPGKKQNDTHYDVAMVLLLALVPLCYEPDFSIFDQILGEAGSPTGNAPSVHIAPRRLTSS